MNKIECNTQYFVKTNWFHIKIEKAPFVQITA